MYPSKESYAPTASPAMGFPVAPPPPANSQSPVEWSTGLCGCTDNVGNCCMTCWCPCVTFGRVAEIVDRGSTTCGTSGALYGLLLYFTGCQWIYSCTYRSKMRAQYNLESSPCNDCCLHFCCEYCALCQEYRELENKGYDMKIGWELNMERKAQGAMLPPVSQPGMMR